MPQIPIRKVPCQSLQWQQSGTLARARMPTVAIVEPTDTRSKGPRVERRGVSNRKGQAIPVLQAIANAPLTGLTWRWAGRTYDELIPGLAYEGEHPGLWVWEYQGGDIYDGPCGCSPSASASGEAKQAQIAQVENYWYCVTDYKESF